MWFMLTFIELAQWVERQGYGLDERGLIPIRGKILVFFSFPQRPNRLRGLPSLLSNGYRGSFSVVKPAGE
jgi:hypothetical protein